MTAYGRTEDSNNEISISCTIKSVNHRYSDISIHLPEELRPLEQKIREHISDKIQRGKVDCNIHIDKHHIHNEILSINQDLLKKIVEASEKIDANPVLAFIHNSPELIPDSMKISDLKWKYQLQRTT